MRRPFFINANSVRDPLVAAVDHPAALHLAPAAELPLARRRKRQPSDRRAAGERHRSGPQRSAQHRSLRDLDPVDDLSEHRGPGDRRFLDRRDRRRRASGNRRRQARAGRQSEPLPEGWFGKQWACATGARRSARHAAPVHRRRHRARAGSLTRSVNAIVRTDADLFSVAGETGAGRVLGEDHPAADLHGAVDALWRHRIGERVHPRQRTRSPTANASSSSEPATRRSAVTPACARRSRKISCSPSASSPRASGWC